MLSSDAIRAELTCDAADQSANARVFALLRQRLNKRLERAEAVTYINATSLTRRERKAGARG